MLGLWRVVLALFAGVCSPLTADVLYSVTDIGISGRFASGDVFAINNAGQVTGTSRAGQAFLYDSGQVLELDRLATFPGASVTSGGLSINDSGQITGYYSSSGSSPKHAFLYRNGQITDLGTLGGLSNSGRSINGAGQITGVADTAAGVEHAFLYTNGQMIDIGTLPGTSTSRGAGINDAGEIVGTAGLNSAFLYTNGQMTDLGSFSPNAINNTGQVVGSNGHAVFYSNGQIIDLGTMGHFFSAAVAINDFGQVVGFAYNPSSPGNDFPFLYSDGQVLDLNTLIAAGQGVRLNQATAINNRGQIVATGFGPGTDLDEVYLLTPTSSAVPEPKMLGMCGLTFIALLAAKRQNQNRAKQYPLGRFTSV